MPNSISTRMQPDGFLAAILQTSNFEQLQTCVRNALTALKLDDLLLRMNTAVSDGTAQCHIFSTLPTPLPNLFLKATHAETDPVDIHFSKSSLPLVWNADSVCNAKQETYSRLKEYGVRWGVSVVVRSERTVCRIDFYGKLLYPAPVSAIFLAELQLLGLYLHEVKRRLVQTEPDTPLPVLTLRERQCLYWVASGKTTNEVGMILGISSHTASFHLKNVAAKLNVYGTRHAISKAITLGIFRPRTAPPSE